MSRLLAPTHGRERGTPSYPGRSLRATYAGESPRAKAGRSHRTAVGIARRKAKARRPKSRRPPPPDVLVPARMLEPGGGRGGGRWGTRPPGESSRDPETTAPAGIVPPTKEESPHGIKARSFSHTLGCGGARCTVLRAVVTIASERGVSVTFRADMAVGGLEELRTGDGTTEVRIAFEIRVAVGATT